jgi:probable O-glycosylation ligase (exosortase A-associated)
MLRLILVFGIVLIGIAFAFQGAFYVLLFYLWNAYFRPESWVWDPIVVSLNLSYAIGIVLVVASVNSFRNWVWNRQTVLIVLFFLQSILSLVMSENPDWSWLWWQDFVKVMLVSLLIPLLVTDRHRYRLTLIVIAYSLGFEMAKQAWAQIVLHPGGTNNNPHPMLGDNNGVAIGMMMLLPVFVALSQTATRRWERYLHRFFMVGVLYRGISTYSRGGFLAAAAVGLVMLWNSPRRARAFVLAGSLTFVVASVMPQSFWDRMKTINAPEDERDASSEGRLTIWGIAVDMADAKPLTGVGFNGFSRSFDTYDTTNGSLGGGRAAHSTWFGVLAEMGYPGLILLVMTIVGGIWSAMLIRWRTRGDPELRDLRSYASAIMASLVAYVVGMTFLNGQYLEMFWHFIALGVALERIAAVTMSSKSRVGERVTRATLTPAIEFRPRISARTREVPRRS